MRIISGKLGGRQFEAPRGHRTHPMGDKVRGAMFNVLGDVSGLSLLDAYAGSGSISFEAVSRGAKDALALDIDKGAITTVVNSAKALGIADQVKAVRAGISSWSDNNPSARFDLIVGDPPYDAVKPAVLEKLARHARPGGTVVFSLPNQADLKLPDVEFKRLAAKSYGDANLVFYRKIQ